MQRVQDEWNKIYDRHYEEISGFPTVHNTVLNLFEQGSLVLEAGCGRSGICFRLEELNVNSLGVDIAPNVVRSAHLLAKTKKSNVQFIIADVTHLPLKNECLDGVISLGVIEHFESDTDAFQAWKETYRILKIDGKALFTVPNIFVPLRQSLARFITRGRFGWYHHFYRMNDLVDIAKMCGFTSYISDVVDLWIPVYFVISGFLKKVGSNNKLLRKIYTYFLRLPQFAFLKLFLGHIIITVRK